jgi:hypothetical protein
VGLAEDDEGRETEFEMSDDVDDTLRKARALMLALTVTSITHDGRDDFSRGLYKLIQRFASTSEKMKASR